MASGKNPAEAVSSVPSPHLRFGLPTLGAGQWALLVATILLGARGGFAQVNYDARFTLEKHTYQVGEPVFCTFMIRNTGSRVFAFSFRQPSRVVGLDLPKEPRFKVTDSRRRRVPDPALRPCGGTEGSVVYGFVSLPPGGTHSERWLLNQWARFDRPGGYLVRAERHLPLVSFNPRTQELSKEPIADALATSELSFELRPTTDAGLKAVFEPYLKTLDNPESPDVSESVLVVTALPQAYFLDRLVKLAQAPPEQHRWDPRQGLEGLARLGTPAAWNAVLDAARHSSTAPPNDPRVALGGYAILLLGEKADPVFLSPLLAMLPGAGDEIRGDILRALGFFHNARANQALFDRLHSSSTSDRANAILGLRNLENKDAVPALIAMLTDPDAEVREVADFALQSLSGVHIKLPSASSVAAAERCSREWHAWWRQHGGSFVVRGAAPCRDW